MIRHATPAMTPAIVAAFVAAIVAALTALALPASAQTAAPKPMTPGQFEAAQSSRAAARSAYQDQAGPLSSQASQAIEAIETRYWQELREAERAYGRDLAVGGADEASEAYAERLRALDEELQQGLRRADPDYFDNVWSERPSAT